MDSDWNFLFQTGIYENLKLTGMDLISNEKLRLKISSVYSYDYPGIISVSMGTNELLRYFIPSSNAYEENKMKVRKIANNMKFLLRYLKIAKNNVEELIQELDVEIERIKG